MRTPIHHPGEWPAQQLTELLMAVAESNRFYQGKFAAAGLDREQLRAIAESGELSRLPLTTKAELVADQRSHPPYGSNLTFPLGRYTRLHQTSGTTTGEPLRWLDTPESWAWLGDCWATMLPEMGLVPGRDRLFFPFSFGPFLGFWAGFESTARLGYFVAAGGGLSSSARLKFLRDNAITVVFATPTYALRLAEVAAQESLDLAGLPVRAVLVAGEPGGHIPETRGAIERAWRARVLDHTGMTEIGPTGFEPVDDPDAVVLLDRHYITEVLDPVGLSPVPDGSVGELVLTNLGRVGSPLIRYRTGDLVRPDRSRGRTRLLGGLLGRTDDMLFVRGNNLYPSALEAVIRRFPEVAEFRVEIAREGALTELSVELEPTADLSAAQSAELAERVGTAIAEQLSFRAPVRTVAVGSLPRFEMKAKRFIRRA